MQKRKAPPGRTSIAQDGVVNPCGPHQRTRRSGSVQALKTRERGASNTRVMTSSRSAGVVALLPAAMSPPFRLQLAQIALQAIEALLPETAIVLQPVGGLLERSRLEPAGPPLRLATARDQTGALQYLEVLGDGGKAHLEGLGQVRDRRLAPGETSQDRAPGGIGEGREGRAEALGRHTSMNLVVK